MTLTEALDNTKSDCEIYVELRAFYNNSYIYCIENRFKQLWFIDSIDDKRENLRTCYYHAMRALLEMMHSEQRQNGKPVLSYVKHGRLLRQGWII